MRYCAFLRGINTGGKSMKMADICKQFEKAGMTDVSSVLATGNILFSSEKKPDELKKILEQALSEHFEYEAFLFLKTAAEISTIVEYCPFEKQEHLHIYAFVTASGMENVLLEEFEKSEPKGVEYAVICGETFYWTVPKGNTLDSKFGKVLGKKNLKDRITSRNINTFEKIINKL